MTEKLPSPIDTKIPDVPELFSLTGIVLHLASPRRLSDAELSLLFERTMQSQTRDEAMEATAKEAILTSDEDQASNFRVLLRLFIEEMTGAAECNWEGSLGKLQNVLLAVGFVLKHWVGRLSGDDIRRRFEDGNEDTGPLARALLKSLIEVVVEIPLETAAQCQLSSEAIGLLIILCSSQLKSAANDTRGDFFLSVCVKELPDLAPALQFRLLRHFVDQTKPMNTSSGVLGSAFGLFFGRRSSIEPQTAALLAERSVLLLLIMAFQDSDEETPNAFRDAIVGWGQQGRDAEVEQPSYSEVFSVICRRIASSEESALLLYLLVYRNDLFRSYTLSLTEPETLVVPLLQKIYETINDNPPYSHLYMLLIILLLFSQDDVFAARSHQITIAVPVWFTERTLKALSLGDFIVLILLKTLLANLAGGRDLFFHSNCVAALANFARFASNVNAYTAQRLVSLFDTASRRWTKSSETGSERTIYEDIMSIALEILNAILSTNLHNNSQLVYAILLRRDLFIQHRSNSRLSDLIENISMVCNYFQSKIDDANLSSATSADEILSVIVMFSKQWSPRTLKTFPELRFQYEAKSEFRTFFLPYVWSLAYRTMTNLEDIESATLTKSFLEEHGVGGLL